MTVKRKELKLFRIAQDMTQAQFADKIGINRSYYSLIEQGKRNATLDFWEKLQRAFNVSDAEMWKLTQTK